MQNERDTITTTKRLYDLDSYIKRFEARVLACIADGDDYLIELDETAFFPAGGGQPSDHGYINQVWVQDVFIDNGRIFHRVDTAIEVGELILGQVDFDLRFRRMQNHSAEHLLCGIIHNNFGYDNIGFHMDEDEVVFDIDGVLNDDELAEMERQANSAIYENVPITVSYPDLDEVDNLKFRSKLELKEGIRLVTIEGYDVCACCAPHLKSTGEIGIIKILSAMQHRGGMRITMVAGLGAYEDYNMLARSNKMAMKVLSAGRYETGDFVEAMNAKLLEANQTIVDLKKTITVMVQERIEQSYLKHQATSDASFVFFVDNLDSVQARNIVTSLKKQPAEHEFLIACFNGNDEVGYSYIAAYHQDTDKLRDVAKLVNEALMGRGGGNGQMIQGSVSAKKKEIEEFFHKNI